MLVPNIFSNRFFDDWMVPSFHELEEADRKLYGKRAARVMRTDIQEKEDHYVLDVDLPGFKKEEIHLSLENGYLTVSAEKGLEKDETTKKGKLIYQERYTGALQRSFYVGDALTEEDITAKFENGVLQITVPKKKERLPERKTIMIGD